MQKIAHKLVNIMNEVAYVEKKGKNEFHHYTYATSADVLEKINKALAKYELCSIVMPELIKLDEVTTAKGNKEHLATVKITVKIIDVESGETIELAGMGSGNDAGDKAIMKAQTAALKYAYMMSFAIATGDDPEKDEAVDEKNSMRQAPKEKDIIAEKAVKKHQCQQCGCELIEKVYNYSVDRFRKPLCLKCQKNYQNKIA